MTDLSAEEAQRLHRLITWESPSAMSAQAAAGKACVWCDGPVGRRATRLQTSAPRLGCGRCYTTRLAWYITWYEWNDHVTGCTTACLEARICLVGSGLRAVHDVARIAADREDSQCISCNHPVHVGELAIPVQWAGTSSAHLGYAHTQCAMATRISR